MAKENKATVAPISKAPNPDTLLEALQDIKTNTHGLVKKGETFPMPCNDCANDLIRSGKAKRVSQ